MSQKTKEALNEEESPERCRKGNGDSCEWENRNLGEEMLYGCRERPLEGWRGFSVWTTELFQGCPKGDAILGLKKPPSTRDTDASLHPSRVHSTSDLQG